MRIIVGSNLVILYVKQFKCNYGDPPEKNILTSRVPSFKSLKVIGTDTDLSAAYQFLLVIHCNPRPISNRFREKKAIIGKFSHLVHLTPQ